MLTVQAPRTLEERYWNMLLGAEIWFAEELMHRKAFDSQCRGQVFPVRLRKTNQDVQMIWRTLGDYPDQINF